MHPKRRPYLQLVTSHHAIEPGTMPVPTCANGAIAEATSGLLVSMVQLEELSSTLAKAAVGLRTTLSGLAETERKLAASHLKAVELAAEAATLERHLRDASATPAREAGRRKGKI